MGRKTRREKEIAELRRQLEILKAQTKSYRKAKETPPAEEEPTPVRKLAEGQSPPEQETALKIRRVDPKFIKKDLLKTLALAILALALLTLAILLI